MTPTPAPERPKTHEIAQPLFVGNDWAEGHHDVYVMDYDGARLGFARFPEGIKGIGGLHEMVAKHASEPAEVVVGIETDRGLWVGALVAAGYQVYAINPKAVSRYRDRHSLGGAKSDRGDAKLLADLVRTDRHNHRPVAGDSPESGGIKIMARVHQNLIWARVRHTNQMRNALREYYRAALETFGDLAHRDAVAILGRAPTPTLGARLTLPQIRAAVQRAGRKRNLDKTARRNTERPQRCPPHSTRAGRRRLRDNSCIAGQDHCRNQPPDRRPRRNPTPDLKNTPTPSSTTPSPDSVPCSAPGRSQRVRGSTPNATPGPSLAETTPARRPSPSYQAANTPSLPARSATGDSPTLSTNGHSVPSTTVQEREPSTTNKKQLATSTTKHSEPSPNRLVGILHGCLKHRTPYNEHTHNGIALSFGGYL